MEIKIRNISKKMMADLHTPVQLLLNLRNHFHKVFLLESSEYNKKENSRSFICFDSLLSIKNEDQDLIINTYKGDRRIIASSYQNMLDDLQKVFNLIKPSEESKLDPNLGFYGYSTFDAVQYFEQIQFNDQKDEGLIPLLAYDFFRFIIVIDHFNESLEIVENIPDGDDSQMEKIFNYLNKNYQPGTHFEMMGDEYCPIAPEDFKAMVSAGKKHCQRGDVFQVVFSRRYYQKFKGDEINVYRALRSINPSPYLFYFDYGSYRIFGSSPETHITINNKIAEIHPIAGTFRRTGDEAKDKELAEKLLKDEKENAEHVMLVDLARNDLNRKAEDVYVEKYKQTQFFSHVIHLTSVVKGKVIDKTSALRIYADSFPAGTLSGAPKYRAMQLIDQYEPHSRSFYGGAIGFIGLQGDINKAIMIRSFLSRGDQLIFQAGCGIVIDSNEESELQEVENKLAALKKALIKAECI